MDEENKNEEVKDEGQDKEAKKAKKSKEKSGGGNGVSTGLQFLILMVMAAMVFLQYTTMQKVENINNGLSEEGKLVQTSEKTQVSYADIELYEVVNGAAFNVKDGTTDRYLTMTVNLGINTKDKAYKKDIEILNAKKEIIKEKVEQIVTSTDMSYFDGADKEYTVKTKILDTLNQTFGTTIVCDVYFSDKIKA
ncbi:MAG: flagellar basal body-associated FliL family protein [Clostridia bacterium]|nr:flagellar basal body-associated FliL family protein [Clostridia bacterium]